MIIHSPIFSGSISQDPNNAYANLSGSFTGSFKGIGQFEGLEADSVAYDNVTNKPTLVSGSSQISYPDLSNIPSGIVSSSAQLSEIFLDTLGDGVISGSSQVDITTTTGTLDISSRTNLAVSDTTTIDMVLTGDTLSANAIGGIVSGSSQVVYTSLSSIPAGIVSGSSQVSYPNLSNIPSGIVSGSAQITPLLPSGIVSGSSQVVYTSLSSIPAGIVSGSSQVTPLLPSGVVSGSSQVNADSITNFDTNVKDKLNTDGVISGSSQVNADTITNFDTNVKAKLDTDLVVSGSASDVKTFLSLGNVTNESKATMFTNAALTGTPTAPTATANTNSTQIATTAYVQTEISDLIGGANAAFDTLLEISASLASGDSTLNTLVDGKLAKASNLSDLTNTGTARTNLGVAIGSDVQAYHATLAAVAGGTYSGDDSITTIGTVTAGSVTAILPSGVVSGSTQVLGNTGIVSGSSQINHDSTTGFVSNEHIDHSTVSVTAGNGLTGGGTIAATRTINVVGTADRISVSADAVDIASTYVGQSTITTLGTITTGTWAATDVAVAHGGTGASTQADARTNLGLVIGTDVQAYDADLTALGGLAKTDGNFIVGNGTTWVVESGATARTSLGVDASGTDNSTNVTLAGTPDYITISGQVITRNQIDLTTDVTGVLPSANLDADTAHLTTTQTFSGAKTFSAAVSITNSTASTTKTTGALIVTGGVGVSGALNVGGDVVAYASSDERLKNNIELISNPIEKVQQLKGVTWEWNENADELQQSLPNVGVIAQDVEKVLPQLVHDRDNGYKGVDYAKLTGLLIEAIKEQQKQIDDLKSRL